ncbi:MAG: hypothetical protein J6U73_00020 [Alistipes sp.]|nr:hypothetical protein [Alistipes sp.]
MRYFSILLSALLLATACSESGGDSGLNIAPAMVATQIERKPFYERNPQSSAPSYEVATDKIRLEHTGLGDNYGTFTLNFPTESCKRVILEYTMGCEGKRPADYDNTTIFFVKDKATNEWHEIVRAFTPFGGLFESDWTKKFYLDVTEFQSLLQGETEFRYFYGGFDATAEMAHAATLKFIHYKGVPERKLIAVKNIYDSATTDNCGNRAWVYGIDSLDIEAEERLGTRSVTIPKGTKSIELRLSITGHGHDQGTFPDLGTTAVNAAEFDENIYTITINGTQQSQQGRIFYSNANNYVQMGTYNFDRANWAPGNPANIHYWAIAQTTGELTLDIDLQRFISQFNTPSDNDGVARYIVQGDLFFYN